MTKFRIRARLDMASQESDGKVYIDRASSTFSVRRLRSRRTFTLPLSTVAEMVVRTIIAAEAREQLAIKMARRKR